MNKRILFSVVFLSALILALQPITVQAASEPVSFRNSGLDIWDYTNGCIRESGSWEYVTHYVVKDGKFQYGFTGTGTSKSENICTQEVLGYQTWTDHGIVRYLDGELSAVSQGFKNQSFGIDTISTNHGHYVFVNGEMKVDQYKLHNFH